MDTSFEYVIIENQGVQAVNLAGWQLYPDGAGYFTFPTFTLDAGSRVTIYMRKEGIADADELYHGAASANMGNTSGSVAIFSSSDHTEGAMADFVQWGRAGETWESTAEKAGLWTKGDFITIDSSIEGMALKRKPSGIGATAWEVAGASIPTSTSEEAGAATSPPPPVGVGGDKVYSGPTAVPTIKAYAGKDMRGVAGGEVRLDGKALGFEDELLDGPNVRFSWNFGDGSALQDGRRVNHVYRYPGLYSATLMVASGENSARDDMVVTIDKNPVIVSELMSGDNGWIEMANPSSVAVDVSGWILKTSGVQQFVFPQGIILAGRSFIVTPCDVLGFVISNSNPLVQLIYPNRTLAQEFSYKGGIPSGRSIADIDGAVVVSEPTPGAKNENIQKLVSKPKTLPVLPKEATSTALEVATTTQVEILPLEVSMIEEAPKHEEAPELPVAQLFKSNLLWLLGSVAVGLIAGIALLFFRPRKQQ